MTKPHRPSRLDPEKSQNFRKGQPEDARASRPTRVAEIVLFSFLGVLVILSALALWATYSPSYRHVPNRVQEGIEQDRVNILVIGIGGPKHIGGGKELADALILASFRPSTGEVALVSIPRDLYVPIGRYGTHRINESHRIGNQTSYPGRGPKLTMDTVSGVLGVPIHAFVRLDFAGFEKIIDQIGGIDVYVEQGFQDFLFDDGFEQGWQHLNGDRALRYARYRYVRASAEGNTFARERRQMQVIVAVRKKLASRESSVAQMIRAGKTLSDHTATNLTTQEMIWLWRKFGKVEQDSIHKVSLQPYVEVFNLKTFAGSGEAVRPTRGDFSQLHQAARNVFEDPAGTAAAKQPASSENSLGPSTRPSFDGSSVAIADSARQVYGGEHGIRN